ncbi:hypothetical protein [Phenylobacterium sp. J367]|uniref:hypothetical protein n=1 Tax=Phenylobacterium sp. J367 TaxID=2898435 RepID=UPI0027E24720|nr:hypothetical protein [Phenylobacterium sp. J367]
MVGTDRLDLSRIFSAAGYSGDDPVADGRMRFDPDGAGGTKLYFDPDQLDGGEWPFHITTLDGVAPAGLTWAKLAGDAPPSSGGIGTGDKGQVIVSPGPGSVLTGGEGADTLVASQGKDRLTGAGGGDHFEFPKLPWNAGHVTDFDPAADRIDLSALFDEYPDGILEARAGAGGGTEVYFDRDQADGGDWPFLITRLDGISPAALGTDWVIV